MIAMHAPTLANLAGHLRDDEIHVWHLAYRREQGRAPLRRVLAAYLGIDADAVTLVDGEHGRPALATSHDQSLGFNWSHSGDQALIALGRHVMPGIDVERRRERPRALEIAQRYFSIDEAATLATLPAVDRSTAFLELWTAKEAVLKALGRGIAFGLHRLSIASTMPGSCSGWLSTPRCWPHWPGVATHGRFDWARLPALTDRCTVSIRSRPVVD
jgi:4'-phosphopantetheinyl transferase